MCVYNVYICKFNWLWVNIIHISGSITWQYDNTNPVQNWVFWVYTKTRSMKNRDRFRIYDGKMKKKHVGQVPGIRDSQDHTKKYTEGCLVCKYKSSVLSCFTYVHERFLRLQVKNIKMYPNVLIYTYFRDRAGHNVLTKDRLLIFFFLQIKPVIQIKFN